MLLDDIKETLGIRHNLRNDVIEREIKWAKAELARVGVPEAIANDENQPLIHDALVSGVCSHMASNEKMRAEYKEMWTVSRDELRKHDWGL